MKTLLGCVLVLLAAATTIGCDETSDTDALTGSGNIIKEEHALADFNEVEAESSFAVAITRSDAFSVEVRADDNIMEYVSVFKSGDTLRLWVEGTSSLSNVTLEAMITMPELRELDLSGASRADISGFRSSEPFDATLSGASRLEGELGAGETEIEASGASRVILSAAITDLTVDASGASTVTLDGSGTRMSVEASGASDVDLEDFVVDTAEVELGGASRATVNVTIEIEAVEVSGASHLRYRGGADLGKVDSTGESTIDEID